MKTICRILTALLVFFLLPPTLSAIDVIPPQEQIKPDRPRLLIRPGATSYAITLDKLRSGPKGSEYEAILARLKEDRHAAALAMVWLLTGESRAADSAVAKMLRYREPEEYDTFHNHGRVTEFALAYDWLHGYSGFGPEVRAKVRKNVNPTAWRGYRNSNDHVFHNYVWMSAGSTALWALATAGEDAEADSMFNLVRRRFNDGMFPAMSYLEGLNSEPLGYWFYYDFAPCMLTVMAVQSAFEFDLAGKIEREQGGWVRRHFRNIVHGVTPDMRFITWGDMQGGSNGGVTIQFAGLMDALTWLLDAPEGAWISNWLKEKRGLERFRRWHGIYYMLYTRSLEVEPRTPSLSYLAGNSQAGQFVMRSDWWDDGTMVAFRCTDHYGDHNHYDQGSFIVYNRGMLAVDPPVYRKVAGPQQPTAVHNTLLIGGKNQRRCRGQWFRTLEIYEENRTGGPVLETGDLLFHTDRGRWAAVAGQFAQAYDSTVVESVVRQLLFVRPGIVVVVDHLKAPAGKTLPEVSWLLQTSSEPELDPARHAALASNGQSTLLVEPLDVDAAARVPEMTETEVNTWTVSYSYHGDGDEMLLAHLLGVGHIDGSNIKRTAVRGPDYLDIRLEGRNWRFNLKPPYEVVEAEWAEE
ncbi:MAG: hypothetical protein FVQ81_16565 [Candidatus Glassbacteria bacterium]|nr:hypothetical protein [Candidatus Glassbacteria bacterium]